ncbi:MAG: transcription elongation factor GreA [Chloroflexi bacterium]|nr:transcription elongation factor GreA [Chloroflexota bacterium]
MVTNSNLTLQEAANRFLAAFSADDRAKLSQETNRFLRWFGLNHPASSLTPPEIGNYAEQVARGGGDYLKRLEPVKSFLKYLQKQGITPANLSVHLKPPPAPAKTSKGKRRQTPTVPKVLTAEGHAELKSQLESLKKTEVPRFTEEITRAREDKDFRENAPLDAAREALAHVQSKIQELEATLKSAVIVGEQEPAAKATIGSTVFLKNESTGEALQFKLVDAREADLAKGKISFVSPLGKSLLGKSPGDIVEVNAPIGILHFRIETVGS